MSDTEFDPKGEKIYVLTTLKKTQISGKGFKSDEDIGELQKSFDLGSPDLLARS